MKFAVLSVLVLSANLAMASGKVQSYCVSDTTADNNMELTIENGQIVSASVFVDYTMSSGPMTTVKAIDANTTQVYFAEGAEGYKVYDVDNSVLVSGKGDMKFAGSNYGFYCRPN